MFKITEYMHDLNLDIQISKGTSLLDVGLSGTGKTYLFTILKGYFNINNISYLSFDYNNTSDDVINLLSSSSNKLFILLDNADLYMRDDIVDFINRFDGYVIISMKNTRNYKFNNMHLCNVVYDNDRLQCKGYCL